MTNTKYMPFIQAQPVWIADREREMNLTARFTTRCDVPAALLRLAANSLYRVFVDGCLAAYGPARAPGGYARVDEIDLTPHLGDGEHILVIEVAGYNVNTFYTLDTPSFLQAELLSNGCVLAHTAPDGEFLCTVVSQRVQKVQRYSFQRAFAEFWRMTPAYAAHFYALPEASEKLAQQPQLPLLPHRTAMPTLRALPVKGAVGWGEARFSTELHNPLRDRSLENIGEKIHGFPKAELEACLTDDAAHYVFVPGEAPCKRDGADVLTEGRYLTYALDHNSTGFLSLKVVCRKKCSLMVLIDELVKEGDLDYRRMQYVCNIARFDLMPGTYDLLSFECYTLGGMKLVLTEGELEIESAGLIEYATSQKMRPYPGKDPEEKFIWDAAVETYRQNALDLFMDCPSRERAGWLCDSFFTARVERILTGKSDVERSFLEDFLLAHQSPFLPHGMFPMCYPADHNDGVFIANWAMWLVLELREYLARSGDRDMVDAFRPKLEDFFAYMDGFCNADGLLENIPGWVFVEWSHANDLVQDVNYPSNMLYAQCKEIYGILYGVEQARLEAEKMRSVIRAQSFDGEFFVDNALRGADGELHLSGERTEVCQYYAFYFGVASPQRDPELWQRLLHDFGPGRADSHPGIAPANAFIGNYLRLDLLYEYGDQQVLREDIKRYFTPMAQATGTLWENNDPNGSLCHGFASHAVRWLTE